MATDLSAPSDLVQAPLFSSSIFILANVGLHLQKNSSFDILSLQRVISVTENPRSLVSAYDK